MMAQGFRPGDVASPAGVMRLTVGGLAEIAARCDAPDVSSLAAKIRTMTPDTARRIAVALLRPCCGEVSVVRLSDAQVAGLMPAAARCITDALAARS
jgi:hypothetical protein